MPQLRLRCAFLLSILTSGLSPAFAVERLSEADCNTYLANTVTQAQILEKSTQYQSHLAAYALYKRFTETPPEKIASCVGNDQLAKAYISATVKHLNDTPTLSQEARKRAAALFQLNTTMRSGEGAIRAGEGESTTRMPLENIRFNFSAGADSSQSLSSKALIDTFLKSAQGDALNGIIGDDAAKKEDLVNAIEAAYSRRIHDLATPVIDWQVSEEGGAPLNASIRPKESELHKDFWSGLNVELARKTDLGDMSFGAEEKAFNDLSKYLDENTVAPTITLDTVYQVEHE